MNFLPLSKAPTVVAWRRRVEIGTPEESKKNETLVPLDQEEIRENVKPNERLNLAVHAAGLSSLAFFQSQREVGVSADNTAALEDLNELGTALDQSELTGKASALRIFA